MNIDKFKKWLKGWEKEGTHQALNTFWKRFFYFPLNWMALVGFPAAIAVVIEGAIRYQSEMLVWFAVVILITFVYHMVDEYYEFKQKTTGKRKYSNRQLINITKVLIGIVVVYIVIRMVTG